MTSEALSPGSCYELLADRYPSLGSKFFTRLREKYPRAFQRNVPGDVGQSPCRSSASSADSKSIWSLWECSGDYDKAVVKEAGGMLIPCSEMSVHERLKRNCDSLCSAKSTGDDLLAMLRSFRSALLADSKSFIPQEKVVGEVTVSHSSSAGSHDSSRSCKDAASNGLSTDSVSRNSSCEVKSLPQDDAIGCSETVAIASAGPGTDDTASVLNSSNAEGDVLQTQSVAAPDDSNSAAGSSADNKNQLLSTDRLKADSSDTELPVEHSQAAADAGYEDVEKASSVDASKQQARGAERHVEAGYHDSSETTDPYHYSAEDHQPDAVSASYQSLSEQQVMTVRKPPLVKKGKTNQRNIGSTFGENVNKTSSFAFSENIPDVPRSAETVCRKLQLPWRKKKKKNYLPGEEMRRWRLNFENWRSASQLSLDVTSEVERTGERGLRRTASHGELRDDSDSVSVGWSDSDTDTVSDDPHAASLSARARRLFAMVSQSVDTSSDTRHASAGLKSSSVRSSARQRLSSLQRSAARRLQRLQKAVSLHSDRDVTDEQTASIPEFSRKRVRHSSDTSRQSDIDSPRHFRPIGRVLSHSYADSGATTTMVELVRPPHGPYGIYLARDGADRHGKVYISRLSDSLPPHFYAGLLHVGDEVVSVNNVAVMGLSLDDVSDMIAQSSKLSLLLRPVTKPL